MIPPRRFRSEAAFAPFAGVAPIPASSGLTNKHRLNRREATVSSTAPSTPSRSSGRDSTRPRRSTSPDAPANERPPVAPSAACSEPSADSASRSSSERTNRALTSSPKRLDTR
ncbi:transposase [Streptomyces tardus]|uniref:transposase n=1 Tax=Streptomyces tardus TaxID=2780544 RepID=UPI001F2C0175|nr:transposase [Streptomyces tardus]